MLYSTLLFLPVFALAFCKEFKRQQSKQVDAFLEQIQITKGQQAQATRNCDPKVYSARP